MTKIKKVVLWVLCALTFVIPLTACDKRNAANNSPHEIAAWQIVFYYHYGADSGRQYDCLDILWNRESGWNVYATNPSSGAYGIPQSLPADKMASIAADWRTNPWTQIRWGLDYIRDVYGNPCNALAHSYATGWY